jgi:RNA polymerase sigma-70 factor (ECF subfamily)
MKTPETKPNFPELISQMELLIDLYQDKLVHHAFFRLGNHQDAEDVVQDVFIRFFNEQKQGKTILNPPAYIFRVVSNSCIDRLRSKSRSRQIPFDDIQETEIGVCESNENELIKQEEYERINALLDSIPDEQAEIVRFRFVDGLPFQHIADILELPLTTVKSRFSYGLLKIKTKFFNQKEVSHAV